VPVAAPQVLKLTFSVIPCLHDEAYMKHIWSTRRATFEQTWSKLRAHVVHS